MQRQEKKRGKRRRMAILEAKIGRAVYHLWRKQVPFDARRFLTSDADASDERPGCHGGRTENPLEGEDDEWRLTLDANLRPGAGSCTAELGQHGRPRSIASRLLGLDLTRRLRHRPDPDRLDWPPDR